MAAMSGSLDLDRGKTCIAPEPQLKERLQYRHQRRLWRERRTAWRGRHELPDSG
jgi:hypothetical protein